MAHTIVRTPGTARPHNRSGLWVPDIPADSLVAVDTETSGLFVDDGARVSMVTIAWWDNGKTPGTSDFLDSGVADIPVRPNTATYAFDQGFDTPRGPKDLSGVPAKKRPTPSLFDATETIPNLGEAEFVRLIHWLHEMSLVFHNSKFDLHILRQGLRGWTEYERQGIPDLSRATSWDTQVCNPVLWPEFRSSLKPTAGRLFGEQEADLQIALQKHLQKNGYRFDVAPWDLVEPYAAKDAELTLMLYDVQQLVIDSGEVGPAHQIREVCEREIDLAIVLYRMEQRGIGFDSFGARQQDQLILAKASAETQILKVEISNQFPATYFSADQVPAITEHFMRQLWFNKPEDPNPGLGKIPTKMTEKGQASVSADVVRDLAEREVPFAATYERLVKLNKAHSMWYSTWPNMTGPPEPGWHPEVDDPLPRLRTVYNQGRTSGDGKVGGTISGRLAVQRVQLQAIPQNYQIPEGIEPIRSFFQADPGYEIWEVDLGQAEFRVAAGVSKCQKMIDLFNSGEDVHSGTAKLMFDTDESDPEWKFLRAVAKRLNFGMLYGAGANTIRRQIEEFTGRKPPIEELEKWLAQYRQTYPEMGRASRRAQRQVEATRRLELAGGRTRWFAPDEFEHKAFNQLIQGGVAEMMKVAMVEVEVQVPGVAMLQIHDSIIAEVLASPEGTPPEVRAIQQILQDTFEAAFPAPFVTDAERWK